MKIGIVGYAGVGKSTLFELLTEVSPDPSQVHSGQIAQAVIPEPRLDLLNALYSAKKVTRAALELVDTPGLSKDPKGNAAKLALIREAECLVLVVAGFSGSDPIEELASFEEDLLFADMEIITKRVEKLQETLQKRRPNQEKDQEELEALLPLQEALEAGKPLRDVEITDEQRNAIRSYRMLTEKSKLIIVNTADDESDPERFTSKSTESNPIIAAPLSLELELKKLDEEEREIFQEEMGLKEFNRDRIVSKILDVSGQMLFFTAGEKEVRTWLVRKGATAVDAAASIHTDLARGFIRAEVMKCDDLLRLGSEREIKAQNLLRKEHKDYEIAEEGEILLILSNA